jgi:hypothetical protein
MFQSVMSIMLLPKNFKSREKECDNSDNVWIFRPSAETSNHWGRTKAGIAF